MKNREEKPGINGTFRKCSAAAMILLVLLLVGYGTWQLFAGNFAAAMATFPLLLVAYLFILSRRPGGG